MSKKENICRAFTFLNCQIPNLPIKSRLEYTTIGFFDGMKTKRIEIDNRTQMLHPLWDYVLSCSRSLDGTYSYQNVFGFSYDRWNTGLTDEEFWSGNTAAAYPLTFVVFMQTQNYTPDMEAQCRSFSLAADKLRDRKNGDLYTYITIDKNDFIVCLKTNCYDCAVETIKELHQRGTILYSYSIFSIRNEEIERITEYEDLFAFPISSICLKGTGNSYTTGNMDTKYSYFCERLTEALFGIGSSDQDFKTYDILGEDDFRYIARNVSLGKIISLYGQNQLLNLNNKTFRKCLYSSNLVLNTKYIKNAEEDLTFLSEESIKKDVEEMNRQFVSLRCNSLKEKMILIQRLLAPPEATEQALPGQEREYCSLLAKGMWQILQSLTALEFPPTKKYDFLTLFLPFQMLVELVEEKLRYEFNQGIDNIAEAERLGNNTDLFEIVRGFSSTLNGTLRTDIQFFQVRDFNVIVYYSPAKLRAFYAAWIYNISEFYTLFDNHHDNCAYVLVPGLYEGVSVEEIFKEEINENKLMLVRISEKMLYEPLPIMQVLAHEAAHYVGDIVRKRELRYENAIKMAVRLLEVETYHELEHMIQSSGFDPTVTESLLHTLQHNLFSYTGSILFPDFTAQKRKTAENIIISQNADPKTAYFAKPAEKIIPLLFNNIVFTNCKKYIYTFIDELEDFLSGKHFMNPQKRLQHLNQLNALCDLIKFSLPNLFNTLRTNVIKPFTHYYFDLCKEIYADEIKILSLGVSPAEYFQSLIYNKVNSSKGNLILLRIGITVQSVHKIINDFYNEYRDSGYLNSYEAWHCADIWDRIKRECSSDENSKELALTVFVYVKSIKDYITFTHDFVPPITRENSCNSNYSYNRNNPSNFWNDTTVFQLLSEYAIKCGECFLENALKSREIQEALGNIRDTFRDTIQDNATDLSWTIEKYLYHFEKKCTETEIH